MIKGYAYIDDLKIYYEDSQNNLEPILFLHGNNEDHTYFKIVKDYFANDYRLIFIDSRDHGLSSKSDDNLDFDVMSNDVLNVLKKLEINKVNIIGFSDGASIALNLALNFPSLINSLVLVGANYKVEGMTKETLRKIKNDFVKNSLKAPFSIKDKDLKKKNLLMLNHPNFQEFELEKIKISTLNMFGSNDCIDKSHSQKLSKLLNAYEVEFANASHDLILEYPDLFAERVISFLKINSFKTNNELEFVEYNKTDNFINFLDYKDKDVQKALDVKDDFKGVEDYSNYINEINYQEKFTVIDVLNMRRIGFIGFLDNELIIRIFRPYRNKGYGYKTLQLFLKYLKNKGYKFVKVNVVEGNKELEKLIKKCGFIKDYLDKTIISKRTKDVITLHSYIFVLDK
jgi:pimeloyl-ACP methyl ester carboxylesterase/RimJ/RimL family protein N-acetyltransferase